MCPLVTTTKGQQKVNTRVNATTTTTTTPNQYVQHSTDMCAVSTDIIVIFVVLFLGNLCFSLGLFSQAPKGISRQLAT